MSRKAAAQRRFRVVAITGSLVAAAGVLLTTAATPTLLWVVEPRGDSVVGFEGVEVMVRFPDEARVLPETLRVHLNGADVTAQLVTGSNGASGQLHELLDGENVLRFQVSGHRGGLPDVTVEQSHEVRFLVRLPQNLDRG